MSQGAFEPFLLLCVQVNELAVDYHLKRRELGQSEDTAGDGLQ